MKHIFVLLAAFSFLFLGTSVAFASSSTRADSFKVGTDQKITGNQYVSADTIEIDGTIQGDLVASAKTITVKGTIEGSLIAVSGKITIDGSVVGSVRTISQDLIINGSVGQDVTSGSQTIVLAKKATVGHNLFITAQEATIDGTVTDTTKTSIWNQGPKPSLSSQFYQFIASFLALALLGVVFYSAQGYKQTAIIFERLKTKFAYSLLTGVVSAILVLPISLLLALTPVGRMLGITVVLLFLLLLIFSLLDMGYFLGKMLAGRTLNGSRYVIGLSLIGLFLLSALFSLPLLIILGMVLVLAALGNRIALLRELLNNSMTPVHD